MGQPNRQKNTRKVGGPCKKVKCEGREGWNGWEEHEWEDRGRSWPSHRGKKSLQGKTRI